VSVAISNSAAMDHAALFEPYFAGDSWNRWRAVGKAVFAAVAGREPSKKRIKELVCCIGRGGGEGLDRIAHCCRYQLQAERHACAMVAARRESIRPVLGVRSPPSRIEFGYIRALFETIPALREMVVRIGAESIELNNSVTIEVNTNSYRVIRGRSILCVVFDEVAFFRSDDSANPDVDECCGISGARARPWFNES
jgi:hypothetical protein